jgi:hypothetical protein
VTERSRYRSLRTGFTLAQSLHELFGDLWNGRDRYNRLLANREMRDRLFAGETALSMDREGNAQARGFQARSAEFRLYR